MLHRRRRRTMTATVLGLILSALLGSTAQGASINWSAPVELQEHHYIGLADAAFSSSNIAIVWNEWSPRAVGVRTSTDGGTTFAHPFRVRSATGASVAMCADNVYFVYERLITASTS